MSLKFLSPFVLSLLTIFANAQTKLSIGTKVENFELMEIATGISKKLYELPANKGVVLLFHSLSCPFVKKYDSRLKELINSYQNQGLKFIFIDYHIETEGESKAELQAFLKSFGENPPMYVLDKSASIINLLGATKMPEVFVLKKVGTNYTMFYQGAIDNAPNAANKASEFFLEDAIKALLSNNALKVDSKKASGCNIEDY